MCNHPTQLIRISNLGLIQTWIWIAMIWKMILKSHSVLNCIKINLLLKENLRKYWPRRDSNPQSSDPKSDAISIRPRGRRSKRPLSLTQTVLKIEKVYMLGKSDIPLDRIPAANSICSHVSSGIIAGSGAGKVRKFSDLRTILIRFSYGPWSYTFVWTKTHIEKNLFLFCVGVSVGGFYSERSY